MKAILLITLIAITSNALAIVPNTDFYTSAEQRISELSISITEIENTLKRLDKHSPQYHNQLQLIDSYEQEILLIEKRIELFQQLEKNKLILHGKGYN